MYSNSHTALVVLLGGHIGLKSEPEQMSLLLSTPANGSVDISSVVPGGNSSVFLSASSLGIMGIADNI